MSHKVDADRSRSARKPSFGTPPAFRLGVEADAAACHPYGPAPRSTGCPAAMPPAKVQIEPRPSLDRRRHVRNAVQCRARIHVGSRQYAGYLHDISRAGAKLRMIAPIRRLGSVVLQLPDCRPLRGRLQWTDSYNAGLSFELALSASELSDWIRLRKAEAALPQDAVIDELAEALCA